MNPVSLLSRLERLMDMGAAFAVSLIMLLGVSDVLLRATLRKGVPSVVEGSELLMVMAVFLAIPYTQAVKGHIRVDILLDRVPPRWKSGLVLFTTLVALLLFSLLVWQTGKQAWGSFLMKEYTMGWRFTPIYPSRMMIAFGCAVLWLRLAVDFFQAGQGLRRPGQG